MSSYTGQSVGHPSSFPFPVGLAGVDQPAEADLLSTDQKAEVMDHIYRRGDRLATRFIALHTLIALLLAGFYQTWFVTGVTTCCAVLLYAVSALLLPRSFITRCLAGVSLQIFVALHIYQMHGLPEMHFFFFTAFTVLIVYQDWKCMWPGALGLIGQHFGFALLHNAGFGAGLYFYEEGYVGFTKLFFHFTIALSEVAICGYWAYLLQRQTLASASQNAGLRTMGEQIQGSERKFRSLIEHALDIITVVDAQGAIRYGSPAIERVLGYPPDELNGRNVFELVHPEDRDRIVAAFAQRQEAATAGDVPIEFRYQHKNGSWRTLEAIGSSMDAGVGGVVINSRDVTERRRAEDALILGEQRYRALVRVSAQILWTADADGTVQDMAEWGEFTGQHPEETRDGGWQQAIHPDDRERTAAAWRQAVATQEVYTAEYRLRNREGVYEHFTVQGVPLTKSDGSVWGWIGANTNITARKQAEEAMRDAKEEAEKANRAKSEFLSRMSHELRTPLNAILGFGQLLEMNAVQPRETESVNHIMKAGRHLLGLIDEVLAISRIEAGKMNLSLEPVSVVEVAQECLTLVGRQAEARHVQCTNRCEPLGGHLPHVQADRQRLRQVLLNLLSNAVKYNREGGHITVSCRELPATEGAPRCLRVEVTDSGQGLPPDKIRQLFMPFERLGAENTKTEGTGLGLAVSKALVEVMGGRIGVDSTPGQGSTFWLELPSATDPLERLKSGLGAEGLAALSGAKHEGTVLYIEDNLSNLRLVEMLLETRPEVLLISAMEGWLGLEMATAHRPDLILLDLHLPDLPGWDVLARLKADPSTRDIPTVIISADATPGQISRLLEAGASDYLTKPIDVAKLMETLSEHLQPQEVSLAEAI